MSPVHLFSHDFFNNAVALFPVIIFAKFVAHRSRRGRQRVADGNSLKAWDLPGKLHAVSVIAAFVGLIIALIATELQSGALWIHIVIQIVTWITLGIAGLILLWDVIKE